MVYNIVLILLLSLLNAQYSYFPSNYVNTNWIALLDNGIPLRKLTIIGSHSSMGDGPWGNAYQTQSNSLMGQMQMGMRALDIRCRHINNQFRIHDRDLYLNHTLDSVIMIVKSFLQTYPKQTILMHIVEEFAPSGNSRTFQETFISYKNNFSDLIWNATSQFPVLGQVRGKIVIIQDFPAVSIHGLMYSTFTVLPHKWYNNNQDQCNKWIAVKSFLAQSNTTGDSRISFWTGNGGSYPYFVASGYDNPKYGPRLAAGSQSPGCQGGCYSCPNFPVVPFFIAKGLLTVLFEGINVLAYKQITTTNITYLGIVFTDFLDSVVIQKAVGLNSVRFKPCPSTRLSQGCSFCSSTGQCLSCNTNNSYIYIASNSSCAAAPGFYLAWQNSTANVAVKCSIPLIGCLTCTSASTCTLCDVSKNYQLVGGNCAAAPGYYLDASNMPVLCNIVGCYSCASATVCRTCSASANFVMDAGTQTCVCDASKFFVLSPSNRLCICQSGYYLNSSNLCEMIPLCPATNSGCLTCALTPTAFCTACDVANSFQIASFNGSYCECIAQYYFDGNSCMSCNTTLTSACLSCVSSSLCLSCKANFTLFYGSCVCLPQYYVSSIDTCLKCPIGCLRCTSGTACSACDTANNFTMVSNLCQCRSGLFLNQTECIHCAAMPGCLTCNQAGCTSCSSTFKFTLNNNTKACQCNVRYFFNSASICEPCTQFGCLSCLSLSNCVQCDASYSYLSAGICKDICGDGLLYTLACDDGNTADGDGCSSTCTVQPNYICVGGTTTTRSLCTFSQPVTVTIKSFIKDPSENTVYLQFNISPNLSSLAFLDFNSVFKPLFPVETMNTVYDPKSSNISSTFTYNQSLNNKELSVQFTPPPIPEFFYMQTTTTTLPQVTDNNLALKIYTNHQYEQVSVIQILSFVIAYGSVVVFGICFIFISKLMAVEMIFIYQLTYAVLILLKKLELFMIPLRNLWIVNGYNSVFKDQTSQLPGRFSQVFYKGQFLANFSIDIIIVLLPIIFGSIFLLVGKITKNKNHRIRAYKILKEWLLSSLLFVQMHLYISIALALQYSSQIILAIVLGGAIELLIIALLVLYIKRPKNFGEYTESFKLGYINKRWYLLVFLCRTTTSFLIGFAGQSAYGMYAAFGIAIISLIAQMINRPYLHNIRPSVNGVFIVSILALYIVSKIYQDSQYTSIYTTYTPFMLVGLLLLALVFNVVCMILYFFSQRKKEKEMENAKLMVDYNDLQGKNLDKVCLHQLKQNLKENLLEAKKLDLCNSFEPQNDDYATIGRIKIGKQLRFYRTVTKQAQIVDYSTIKCRLNFEFDDQPMEKPSDAI